MLLGQTVWADESGGLDGVLQRDTKDLVSQGGSSGQLEAKEGDVAGAGGGRRRGLRGGPGGVRIVSGCCCVGPACGGRMAVVVVVAAG